MIKATIATIAAVGPEGARIVISTATAVIALAIEGIKAVIHATRSCFGDEAVAAAGNIADADVTSSVAGLSWHAHRRRRRQRCNAMNPVTAVRTVGTKRAEAVCCPSPPVVTLSIFVEGTRVGTC